jgi:hypothetical protein
MTNNDFEEPLQKNCEENVEVCKRSTTKSVVFLSL